MTSACSGTDFRVGPGWFTLARSIAGTTVGLWGPIAWYLIGMAVIALVPVWFAEETHRKGW